MLFNTRTAFSCALVALLTANVHAVDLDWIATGPSSTFFNSPGNWSPPQTPSAADNVTFSAPFAPPIFINSLSEALDLNVLDNAFIFDGSAGSVLDTGGTTTIDDAVATALANGASLTMTTALDWDNQLDVLVGVAGYGTLNVQGNTIARVQTVYLGRQAGSVGEFNVDGTDTLFQTDGPDGNFGYFIGESGTGTLNVTGGAVARIVNDTSGGIADFELGVFATGNGTINVDGADSQIIAEDSYFGRAGSGAVNITNGGQLLQTIGTNADAFVANDTDSTGAVTVNGDDSQWQADRIEIANLGTATLSVEAGGFVRSNANDMTLADAGGSGQVAVFGSGTNASRLETANDLYIGNLGLGQLFVGQDLMGNPNGTGELSVGSDLRIGTDASNTMDNKVVLNGANVSAMVGDVVFVGELGEGTLEIRNGATLNAQRPRVGSGADANGTLLVTGTDSSLTATTDMTVGTNGTANATISDGGLLQTQGILWVGYQGASEGTLIVDNATVDVGVGNSGNFLIGGRTDSANAGGTGAVTVQNGGLITSALDTIIGGNGTSSGSLTVTGVGSVADFSDNGPGNTINDVTTIGSVGGGEVDILAGGRLDAEGLWLNSTAGNTQTVNLTVDGSGSTVNIDGAFVIGNQGRAVATISGGAQVNTAFNPDTNVTNRRVIIGNGSASDGSSLTLTGAGTRLDYFDTERVSVGLSGGSTSSRAKLEVLDGAVLQAVQRNPDQSIASQGFVVVGDEANAHGQIDVDGAGSMIEARYLELGQQNGASGIVNITNGGLIQLTEFSEIGALGSGTGTMNVSGADARFEVDGDLSVGASSNGATGNLNLSDGGTVTNGDQAFVGRFSTSTGIANIGGAGALATWEIGNSLYIAGTEVLTISGSQTSGSGTLNINANGLVDVTGTTVIKDRGAVTLDGGELATDDLLFQDFADSQRPGSPTFNFNSGTLRLTNGSGNTLDSTLLANIFANGPQELVAGQHLAVEGTTVISAPLRLNGGTLSVGTTSAAELANVDWDAGALNITDQNLTIGAAGLLGDSVIVNKDQSLSVPNGLLTIQGSGDLNVVRGGLTVPVAVNNGLLVISKTTDVDFDSNDNGTGLTNNGDLVAIDATIAGAVLNNGNIEIVGTVDFVDGLTLAASGALGIDLNGTTEFDSLSIAGDASLGGLFNVDVSGFTLSSGDEFEILDVDGNLSGTFAGLADRALVGSFGGVDLFIDYNGGDGNDVVLFTDAAADVDLDDDGDVDGADFLLIQRTDPSLIPAWESAYGGGEGPVSASQVVPEPGALVLLILAAATNLVARRR